MSEKFFNLAFGIYLCWLSAVASNASFTERTFFSVNTVGWTNMWSLLSFTRSIWPSCGTRFISKSTTFCNWIGFRLPLCCVVLASFLSVIFTWYCFSFPLFRTILESRLPFLPFRFYAEFFVLFYWFNFYFTFSYWRKCLPPGGYPFSSNKMDFDPQLALLRNTPQWIWQLELALFIVTVCHWKFTNHISK